MTLAFTRKMCPFLFNDTGKHYVRGAQAEALLDAYLLQLRGQPFIVT